MNIYEKLQTARVKLGEAQIKKSGRNPHQKFDYLELIDFSPVVQTIFNELKLCGVVTFTNEVATLTIYDIEKPDSFISFTSPMAGAKLPGAHDIQNLGAVQTYQRRYLYMAAMEITAPDQVDASAGKTEQKTAPDKEDNRPWLTDELLKKALTRINAGEDIFKQTTEAFRMKKEYFQTLKTANDERISRTQEPTL